MEDHTGSRMNPWRVLTSEMKVYVYLVARYDEIKRERTWYASIHFQNPLVDPAGHPQPHRYVNGTDYYLIPPNCRSASETGVKPLKNCRRTFLLPNSTKTNLNEYKRIQSSILFSTNNADRYHVNLYSRLKILDTPPLPVSFETYRIL